MLSVLALSDKQVRDKLLAHVQRSDRTVLVTMIRHGPELPDVADREPFATLEDELDGELDIVVVLDEGKPEGMWRDPVGDLAEALYPDDRSKSALAAHAYFLIRGGRPVAAVKKRSATTEDARAIVAALREPAPGEQRTTRPPDRSGAAQSQRRPSRPGDGGDDPYAVLGIRSGAPLAEARKAFRELVAQYHPDKVAHLAPEFRELAERRTRELTAAWEAIRKAGRS